LRQTHRVLGVLANEEFAKDPDLLYFDFKTWIASLKSGQSLFNSLCESRVTGTMTIAWNPSNASTGAGGYGVAYELVDGTTCYVRIRGKVQRWSMLQAGRAAEQMNHAIEDARSSGDP
jgi:hypothetical protein